MKKILALLLALTLCLGLAACGGDSGADKTEPDTGDAAGTTEPADTGDTGDTEPAEPADTGDAGTAEPFTPAAEIGTDLGLGIADFTFETYDGQTYSLYETLKTKKMVLINCWATWCGPCQAEFPYMTAAYENYKDDIEIFALSGEPDDTNEILADYVTEVGMTFPVGRDEPGIGDDFATGYIPTTLIVDRFGVVCYWEYGSMTSQEDFERLFDYFVGDDYTESVILEDGLPPMLPNVAPADPADIAAAIGSEGVTFANPADEYNWPVAVDGDTVVTSNAARGSSVSSVEASFTAAEGDVFSVEYRCSTEAGYDFMVLYLDGEPVKLAAGEKDWTAYATAVTAGEHTVTLAYEKDEASDDGEDLAAFRAVKLLSGDEAAAALAAMPVYPTSDKNTITLTNPNAVEVNVQSSGLIEDNFGDARCFIVPDDTVTFALTLAEGSDAELNTVSSNTGDEAVLSDCVDGEAYTFTTSTYSGRSYTTVEYMDPLTGDDTVILVFASPEQLNLFLAGNLMDEDGTVGGSWRYTDSLNGPSTAALPEGSGALEEGTFLYYLVFSDQNGDPVPGVTANVCDDDSCIPMESDENGIVTFAFPGAAYHIQVIKVPDGYAYDTSKEGYLEAEGGVTSFEVTKN